MHSVGLWGQGALLFGSFGTLLILGPEKQPTPDQYNARMESEALDPIRVLLSTYLFQDISPAALEPLAATMRSQSYRRGEYLFHAGAPADFLHVVAVGRVKNSMTTSDGYEFIFEVVTPGGVFGEPGLFSRERNRLVDSMAMEPSIVFEIRRDQLIDFLHAHQAVMMRFLEGLAAQAREPIETVTDVVYTQIRERVVRKLLLLAAEQGQDGDDAAGEVALAVSQTTLAGLVGATRENVNRALSSLAADGDLRVVQGRIVIADLSALRAKASRGWPQLHRRNLPRGEAKRKENS
jgi:CRP/FNR family transcriptional regulator, cyclic AMP receptor protein